MLDIRKKIVAKADPNVELEVVGTLENGAIVGHIQVGPNERQLVMVSRNSGAIRYYPGQRVSANLTFMNAPTVYADTLGDGTAVNVTKVDGKIVKVEVIG